MVTRKVAVKSKAPTRAAAAAKKAAPAKAVKKAAAAKKSSIKKTPKKIGTKLACMVCGYAVTVDQVCGCVEEHALICCGTPMKTRKT